VETLLVRESRGAAGLTSCIYFDIPVPPGESKGEKTGEPLHASANPKPVSSNRTVGKFLLHLHRTEATKPEKNLSQRRYLAGNSQWRRIQRLAEPWEKKEDTAEVFLQPKASQSVRGNSPPLAVRDARKSGGSFSAYENLTP